LKSRHLSQWISKFLEQHPTRANSLIITIYGDFIAPHGGTVWLGSFIRLVEPLGLNERMVRTSVYRLSQEKWLVSEQIGRRSYYSLTTSGRRRFEHAYRRIYFAPQDTWGRRMATGPDPRLAGRRGTRPVAQGADLGRLTAPWRPASWPTRQPTPKPCSTSSRRPAPTTRWWAMRASNISALTSKPLQELVHACWNLDALTAKYEDFIERFRPVLRTLRAAHELDPEQCFLVQTLLMHDFRRALLHDPQLPAQLLPANWSGGIARQLCRDIYAVTWPHAQRHLLTVCETASGPLPPLPPTFMSALTVWTAPKPARPSKLPIIDGYQAIHFYCVLPFILYLI
jgi:phenylacetic acid degradation operon negative regulatory protein